MADQEQDVDPNAQALAGRFGPAGDPRDPRFRQEMANSPDVDRLNRIDLGFAQAGAMFGGDPASAAAWQQYGQSITGVMQQRWFQKEFESFESQYLQPYTEQIRGIDNSLTEKFGQIDNGTVPDGSATPINPDSIQAARLKSNLLAAHTGAMAKATDDLLHATTKYGSGNPIIAQRIQSIMEAHTQQIGQLTNPQQLIAGEKGFADIATAQEEPAVKRAEADERKAHAWSLRHPQETSSGAEWDALMNDPMRYKERFGAKDTLQHLMTTTGGRSWMASDYDGAMASIKSTMIDRAQADTKFAESVGGIVNGQPANEVKFNAELERRSSQAMAMAATAFIKRTGDPELIQALKDNPTTAQYWKDDGETPPEEIVPQVKGLLSMSEEDEQADNFGKNIIRELEEEASAGNITTEAALIETAKGKIAGRLTTSKNPGARRQAKILERKALKYVADNWRNDSATLRRVLGKPDVPDILGEAGRKVERKVGQYF